RPRRCPPAGRRTPPRLGSAPGRGLRPSQAPRACSPGPADVPLARAWGPSVQPYSTPALLFWASRPLVLLDGDPPRPGVLSTWRCDNQQPIAVLRRHLV